MSEMLPGFPSFDPSPPDPIDAAAIPLYRRRVDGEIEVFWVRRGKATRFSAGFHAFLGGRIDDADAAIPVRGASGFEATIRATACREMFEESGVLAARGADRIPAPRLIAQRRALLAGEARFADILAEGGLTIDAEDFPEAGRWITPPFLPMRYDARLFLVELPQGQTAEVWSDAGELAEGGFIRPADALARWRAGTALLHPPNLNALRVLGDFQSKESALDRLRNPSNCPGYIAQRIEFQQGIRIFPVRTPTLPPATHTNCYLIGNRELVVVDPGTPDPNEQRRLIDHLAAYFSDGFRLAAVLLTHRHQDHIGGAEAVSRHFAIPIWAHASTAEAVSFSVDRRLVDGEAIVLAGDPAMRFQVVHTPGHARGHVCLLDEASRALIAGDMLSGVSTIVIDPPEGDMSVYLASLDKLIGLRPSVIYPAHGPAILDGPGKLREYIVHRKNREDLIVEALRGGPRTLAQVVARAYEDTPEIMHAVAERSALATLIKLTEESRVTKAGGHYALAGDGSR
jgi:endoribonuclease LACTB2